MARDELPFLPYGRQCLGEEEVEAVARVLRGDFLTQGPEIERFEEALREATGARHAVAVSSGTAALHLAMLALGAGPDRTVATSPLTFAATANAVLYAGGRPLFADVDDATWCLAPDRLEEVLDEARPSVAGIAAVHFAGLPAHVEPVREIARRRGLFLLEDACHSLGARWRDAKGAWHRVGDGASADATVLSFHPVKHVTTGEGGAVLTPHEEVARKVRDLRHHGIVRDPERLERRGAPVWHHEMQSLGFNYRITDVQCALGRVQLGRLEGFVARRRALAGRYRELLASDPRIVVQAVPEDAEPAWHLFAVRVPRRDAVLEALRAERIGAQVHYVPVYQHPYYRRIGYQRGLCPIAESHAASTLSLPLYPTLRDEDQDRVVATLRRCLDAVGCQPGEATA